MKVRNSWLLFIKCFSQDFIVFKYWKLLYFYWK